MTSAAERLADMDDMPARILCQTAISTLEQLCTIMNEETTLLRAGRAREASTLTGQKTTLAQEYVGLVRSIQRQTARLLREAPAEVRALRAGHERLAVQMAENLKVLAVARDVTENILTDVAQRVGGGERTRTYGASGVVPAQNAPAARGIAIDRAG